MLEDMDLIRTRAARAKVRYTRGTAWLQFIINFSIIATAVSVFQSLIPPWLPHPYVCALVAYIIGCYIIGWADEKGGIWRHENLYGAEMSPMLIEQMKKLSRIEKAVLAQIDDGK